MSATSLEVADEVPQPMEYVELRSVCGMGHRTLRAATLGLPRSLYSVTIRSQGRLIGMGRLIGDLGCHVQIADIAVHPEFQRKQLGTLIMSRLMVSIKKECPDCCFVNLFSDVDFLYQKFGFVLTTKSKGMHLDRKASALL